MARSILSRLAQTMLTLIGVLALVFAALRLSGDPVLMLVPEGASQAEIETLRQHYGLDQTVLVQFMRYARDLLLLDFGTSLTQRQPALTLVLERAPYTLALAGVAFALAAGGGIMAGAFLALRPASIMARIISALTMAGQSLPPFLSSLLLMLLFAVTLQWLPSSGAEGTRAILLPALSLGLISMATFARMTAACLRDEFNKGYVSTALARGLSARQVLTRHIARNAALPVLALSALEAGNLVSSTVIVETVFAWPGIGQLALQAMQARDFPVVQCIVLLISSLFLVLNLVAEALYAGFDPRLRGAPL